MTRPPQQGEDTPAKTKLPANFRSWRRANRTRLLGKRLLDVFVVALTLPMTLPLGLMVGTAVRLKLGSPVIFSQRRPGLEGKPFTMYKFRTMTNERDAVGELLDDSERLTRFGNALRRSSLDELPELYNVLKGDMSLVGPRPLLLRYQKYFTSTERRRSWVRPGITGLAQTEGRNNLAWDDRLRRDVHYVEFFSLRRDATILVRTARALLTRDGVVVDPGAAMLDLDEERSRK